MQCFRDFFQQRGWWSLLAMALFTLAGTAVISAAEERWVSIGPFGTPYSNGDVWSGQVNAVAVHPTDSSILYLGASDGGVWKSFDGGASWKALTDGFTIPAVLPTDALIRELPEPSAPLRGTLAIGALAINPTFPEIVYAGTGNPNIAVGTFFGGSLGVFRSTDGGTTWQPMGINTGEAGNRTMSQATVYKMVVRPRLPHDIVVAATDQGLFEYVEGGSDSWMQITAGVPASGSVTDLVEGFGRLYAAFQGSGIYRETFVCCPAARLFVQLTASLPPAVIPNPHTGGSLRIGRIALGISPANNSVLYAGFQRRYVDSNGQEVRSFYELYRTPNGGISWGILPTPPSDDQLGFNNVIAVDPQDPNAVYVGQIALWRATDGGESGKWTNLSCCLKQKKSYNRGLDLHADLHDIVFDPSNPKVLYVANDGGVTKGSLDAKGVVTWKAVTPGQGPAIGQCGTIGLSPQNADAVICGLWHNGNAITADGGTTWTQVGAGDGFQTTIDAGAPGGKTVVYFNTNALFGGAISRATSPNYTKEIEIYSNDSKNQTRAFWSDPYRWGHLLRLNDPKNAQDLGKLFRTKDADTKGRGGLKWIPVEPSANKSGNTTTVAFKRPVTPDELTLPVYYLGTDTGEVWRGSPEVAWGKIFDVKVSGIGQYDNSGRLIQGIAEDPNDPHRVFVVLAGATSPGRVAKIILGSTGGSINQFIDKFFFTAGLKVTAFTSIVVDPVVANTLYIGTDQGIYRGRQISAGWDWDRSPGVPHVWVTDLELQDPAAVVRAGTFGRGVFELCNGGFDRPTCAQ